MHAPGECREIHDEIRLLPRRVRPGPVPSGRWPSWPRTSRSDGRLGRYFLIADLASARRANPFERALFRASTRDETVMRAFESAGSRRASPAAVMKPSVLARIVRYGSGR